MADADLDSTLDSLHDVRGWLTRSQAVRLWERASALPPGRRIVEIGSFQGRSTIVLASAASPGVEVIAIDPHGGTDRGPREIEGFADEAHGDRRAFEENLVRAGVRHRVTHIGRYSSAALGEVPGAIDLLYVDGAHRLGPALADLRRWGGKVPMGGTMLVHDAFSSVGVTLALVMATFFGSRWRYEGRSGSLVEFRRVRLRGRDRVTNAMAQGAQLPWFARNLVVKMAIVGRLSPLYRALGSDGTWPY